MSAWLPPWPLTIRTLSNPARTRQPIVSTSMLTWVPEVAVRLPPKWMWWKE